MEDEKLVEQKEKEEFAERLKAIQKDRLIELADWWGHRYHGHGGIIVTNNKEVYSYQEYFNEVPDKRVERRYISIIAYLNDKDIKKISKFIEKEIMRKEYEDHMIFDAGYDVIANYNGETKVIKNNTDRVKKKEIYDKTKKLLDKIIKKRQ